MLAPTEKLPSLIEKAAAALARATTAAEFLEARRDADVAYSAAKKAAQWAKLKDAHDTVLAACRKAMADALVIETRAQCRLADEYDAAQDRGEVSSGGRPKTKTIPNENSFATVTDIGLTSKQVHEARVIRDAEKKNPGVVRKTLDAKLEAGEEPTRADVKRATKGVARKPKASSQPRAKVTDPYETKIIALADSGKTHEEISIEVGIHKRVVGRVIQDEHIRREAAAKIDPATLSMSAQAKLATAIRQHKRQLDISFYQVLQDEIQLRLEQTILPHYKKTYEEYQRIIKGRMTKSIMTRAAYRLILSCLHPDRVQDMGLKKRYEEAFHIFTELEKRVLDEKDSPTPSIKMPTTAAELDTWRAKAAAARRTKRNAVRVRS